MGEQAARAVVLRKLCGILIDPYSDPILPNKKSERPMLAGLGIVFRTHKAPNLFFDSVSFPEAPKLH
jgi:hypothetical protein